MSDDLAQLEHVFRAVVLATFADGEPSAVELKTVAGLLADYPDFAAQHDLKQFVVETYRLIKRLGAAGMIAEIAAGLTDVHYRELAFTLASKVVAADGQTAGGEAKMLAELQAQFGLSPQDVLRLLS